MQAASDCQFVVFEISWDITIFAKKLEILKIITKKKQEPEDKGNINSQ